jgi:hypothetical protein
MEPPGVIPLTAGAISCHPIFSWAGNRELTSFLGLHTGIAYHLQKTNYP